MTAPATAPRIQLGTAGPTSAALGLGCMGLSPMYGATDDATGIGVLHAAIDAGLDLLDTGDFYAMGHNEMLIGRALAGGRRDKVRLSVKFGALRSPDGGFTGVDGRPAAVKNFVGYSLRRLGTDHIDIYRLARLDPQVPIEDTVGAVADLVRAGHVRHIGLSEVGADTVRRAQAVHPISDLQIEYSLISRAPEAAIFPALRELGVGVTAYGVLSRGLLSGSRPQGAADFRAHLPRFTGDNLVRNAALADALARVAAGWGATPAQAAIAWVRAQARRQGIALLPLVGARTLAQLDDALGALRFELSDADLAALEAAVPADAVAGTRYDAAQMAHLDSEH